MSNDFVTVAVHGPDVYRVFDGPNFVDQGPELGYAERIKVEVAVVDSSLLGDIIDAAAAQLGVSFHHGGRVSDALTGVVFYEPEDERAFKEREQPWPRVIRIVDEAGQASWSVLWTEIRFDELLAASEAGLLVGDPRRPYFWPVIPQGDGAQTFAAALWTLWMVWEHLLAGYGTFDLARRLRERVTRARETFQQEQSIPWDKRLARPHDFFAYVTAEPRRAEDVASLLGCPVDHAEAVLWGLGLACQDDGLWSVGGDDSATVLYESIDLVRQLGHSPGEERIAELLHNLGSEQSSDAE